MTYRQKTLTERQLDDIVDLTDNSGGTASNTLAAGTNIDAITDSSGGTANTTLEAVGDTSAGDESGAINNNFADLAAQFEKQRTLNGVLLDHVASLSAKVNELLEAQRKDA